MLCSKILPHAFDRKILLTYILRLEGPYFEYDQFKKTEIHKEYDKKINGIQISI